MNDLEPFDAKSFNWNATNPSYGSQGLCSYCQRTATHMLSTDRYRRAYCTLCAQRWRLLRQLFDIRDHIRSSSTRGLRALG